MRVMRALSWLAVCAAALAVTACEPPPVEVEQLGFRGTGMEKVTNLRSVKEMSEIPPAPPAASPDGPRAADIYENVQVLGDLSLGQFVRVMQNMTTWVAPDQGCTYCHVEGGSLAADDLYTKVVARRMLQMTRGINSQWTEHVGATGVTCYTCHRGNNVPEYGWFNAEKADSQPMVGANVGQNRASPEVGYASLPYDPFERYLTSPEGIRVLGERALPNEESTASIQDTERTYALMMHLSQALGVNCTHCHNSRAFSNWEQSSPVRTTAWRGLRMVAGLNNEYLVSVTEVLPPNRLGPTGDVQKLNCMTCHQGQPKPLNGAPMLENHPELVSRSE